MHAYALEREIAPDIGPVVYYRWMAVDLCATPSNDPFAFALQLSRSLWNHGVH